MSVRERFAGRPHAAFASRAFAVVCAACACVSVLILLALLGCILKFGWLRLDWEFLTSYPSNNPEKAGIKSSLVGSLYLIGLTAAFTVPLGIGTAIYLEEYAPPSRWRTFVQMNIANLAGVPSIVYGILGLGLFVRALSLNRSVIAGALTLTLVVLPIVILAAQESLRAVPNTVRQASFALGATRWQTVWRQLLPAATPGMMTGVILALSRALGEAAPLVAIGAATFVRFLPQDLVRDDFSAMPLQIFTWTDDPRVEFHEAAATAIIVLLAVLILMNSTAVFLRYRFSRRIQW
ncbi:MAG: phosphate ABC transporter permease PstA [Planctomycetota bacterium]